MYNYTEYVLIVDIKHTDVSEALFLLKVINKKIKFIQS